MTGKDEAACEAHMRLLVSYPDPCSRCRYNWPIPSAMDCHCQREEACPQNPMDCKKFKRNK